MMRRRVKKGGKNKKEASTREAKEEDWVKEKQFGDFFLRISGFEVHVIVRIPFRAKHHVVVQHIWQGG